MLRKFVEAKSHDCRHSGTDDQRLARAERRQEGQEAPCGIGHRGADDLLVVFVAEPHGEHGTALRDQRGIELMRALGHQPEENAMLAAFLGDARQPLARRTETDDAVRIGVIVRFLANDQQRTSSRRSRRRIRRPAGTGPRRSLPWSRPGMPANCTIAIGCSSSLSAKQLAQDIDHRVARLAAIVENECVAGIFARSIDAHQQPLVAAPRRRRFRACPSGSRPSAMTSSNR